MTADALQELANETMEDNEATGKPTIINLTLSQSLTQAQETILVLYMQIQTLQAHINSKKPEINKPETDKKKISTSQKATSGRM